MLPGSSTVRIVEKKGFLKEKYNGREDEGAEISERRQ